MSLGYDITQKHACEIKIGFYTLIDNPCKITNVTIAKTGKHGHMKVTLLGNDMITNKNITWTGPGHTSITTFNPIRINYQIVDINDDDVECLDNNANVQFIKMILPDLNQRYPDTISDTGF